MCGVVNVFCIVVNSGSLPEFQACLLTISFVTIDAAEVPVCTLYVVHVWRIYILYILFNI